MVFMTCTVCVISHRPGVDIDHARCQSTRPVREGRWSLRIRTSRLLGSCRMPVAACRRCLGVSSYWLFRVGRGRPLRSSVGCRSVSDRSAGAQGGRRRTLVWSRSSLVCRLVCARCCVLYGGRRWGEPGSGAVGVPLGMLLSSRCGILHNIGACVPGG